MKKPAIFLDRDGTLIEEVNFLSSVEDLRLFSNSRDTITELKHAGFLIVVVTNQSGIARGHFDESAMHAIHDEIQNRLDGAIDAFYFCPHLPNAGCKCRKPSTGMIDAAACDFDIDLNNSWMIGDKAIDVQTGFNANLRTALVLTGYGEIQQSMLDRPADITSENIGLAAKAICRASGYQLSATPERLRNRR